MGAASYYISSISQLDGGGPIQRPDGGREGEKHPSSTYLSIAQKRKQKSLPNFAHTLRDKFLTSWPKEFSEVW